MTDKPAKYFDDILKILASEYNRVFTYTEVLNQLYAHKRRGQNAVEKFLDVPIEPEENNNFLNSLAFLNKQGLIFRDELQSTVSIQTEGFIKIKTKGFEKEINDANWNQRFQRINQIATPIIALIALCLGLFNSFSKKDVPYSNTEVKNAHKYENTK